MNENIVKAIWAKVLKCNESDIDNHSGFIDLGGESLGFVIMVDMLERSFGASHEFFDLGMDVSVNSILERLGQTNA